MWHDTIAALSTPLGRGGIAVIRLSGQNTLSILAQITRNLPRKIVPRTAYHAFIHKEGQNIDECLVTYFKEPKSYTGEDLAEISVHSNPFVIEAILDLIFAHQARQALPGEFTYRAFKNGKIDLIQAEAVDELINANSRHFALMKFDNLEGRLSGLVKKLREQLTQLGILVESIIEFQEDQFLGPISLVGEVEEAARVIDRILTGARFNDTLDRGLHIVIAGKVNVGKSSLFNHLLMEERSIISATPGTTRDFIRERLYIDGYPFEITDVAGMSHLANDHVETQGIRRSLEKIEKSDAVIFMLDASREVDDSDLEIYKSIRNKERVVLVNKIDIAEADCLTAIKERFKGEELHQISVKDNINTEVVSLFLKGLVNTIESQAADFSVNHRQKQHLTRLNEALKRISELARQQSGQVELLAEEIRAGLHIMGELTGQITSDDILDGIFSRFCVGK
jgi:tRNA modification GTPase